LKALLRRLSFAMIRIGVLDGLWTASASVGSKFQTLVLIAVAGSLQGLGGTADVILAVSIALLCFGAIDMGLSLQVTTLFAARVLTDRRSVLPAAMRRTLAYFPLTVAIAFPLMLHGRSPLEQLGWGAAILAYGVGYQWSSLMTQMAWGRSAFKSSSALVGIVRLSTIPLFLILARIHGLSPFVLILTIAAGEICIAAIQFRFLTPSTSMRPEPSEALAFKNTYNLGIGSICNTIMNKSDTVLVAAASSAAVATYGLASQVENALGAAALIPAAALITYSAKQTMRAAAQSVAIRVTVVVAIVYVLVGVPFLLWPSELTEMIFHVSLEDPSPMRLCVVAGLFSCIAGSGMQHLIGIGLSRIVAIVWIVVTVVAVIGLITGTSAAGAVGGAVGALVRDVIFCALVWGAIARFYQGANDRRGAPRSEVVASS
jgi:hypothetical protein